MQITLKIHLNIQISIFWIWIQKRSLNFIIFIKTMFIRNIIINFEKMIFRIYLGGIATYLYSNRNYIIVLSVNFL